MKPSDDALVTVEDLSVTLGGKAILQHLHTRIPRGQITALIGLNGSGKTTFLRAIWARCRTPDGWFFTAATIIAPGIRKRSATFRNGCFLI
jgi:ABC-type Mn2+/Zn2+ transport system ATPase subunit